MFPDPYYWWEAGAVFDSLIEYSALTGDNQYDDLIGEAMFHQAGKGFDYMPANQSVSIGNDDQSTWALAAMSAAEHGFSTSKIGNLTWINLAKTVWESQAARWDNETCDGGFRWQIYPFNRGFDYKNSISQGQFILLSTRLAKFTGNSTYSDWAAKVFKWTQDIGLVDDTFHIYDGASAETDCSKIDRIQWSHNNGVLAEAAALMYNLVSLLCVDFLVSTSDLSNVRRPKEAKNGKMSSPALLSRRPKFSSQRKMESCTRSPAS